MLLTAKIKINVWNLLNLIILIVNKLMFYNVSVLVQLKFWRMQDISNHKWLIRDIMQVGKKAIIDKVDKYIFKKKRIRNFSTKNSKD